MPPLPDAIRRFLLRHHVVGLATCDERGEPWAASCFYAFDPADSDLIVLTDPSTRHGRAMLARPQVAGTIAGQPGAIAKIQGIQFSAHATLLAGDAAEAAYAFYCRRHPVARLKRGAAWRLALQQVKFTDNALVPGNKTYWQRGE